MKNKQKKIFVEVKRRLHTAMDTADREEAEDIFADCYDLLNQYHMRDRSIVDTARENWERKRSASKVV